MVRKVTLDTLEIEEGEVLLPSRTPLAEEESSIISARRPAAKWLWISALALAVLIAAGGVSYWLRGANRTSSRVPSPGVPAAAPLRTGGSAAGRVNDFIVTLQDEKGKYLIMTCDLAFELNAGQDALFQQNMVNVRKIIYETLKKTRMLPLLEPRLRSGLKEDINKALNGLLGQDAIKAVYFTKFVVLS